MPQQRDISPPSPATYRVVFAANQTLELGPIANHLVRTLASLPMVSTVLLRRPRSGNPGAFEVLTAQLCATLGISVEWRVPDPGGRSSVFERDVSMVRSADHVVCYFDPDTPMAEGTGHIIDRAIEEDVGCEAWTLDKGDLTRIGEIEHSA